MATHSCRCIESIASHVLNTLDRPACKASRTLPDSPAIPRPSTSNTTTRHRLGLSLSIFSSTWLPRGPANLHRAVVPRLSSHVQCPSPCRFHWTIQHAAKHPKASKPRSDHPAPVHWEVSFLHPGLHHRKLTACQGMPVHPSIHKVYSCRHTCCWFRNPALSINPSLRIVLAFFFAFHTLPLFVIT
jgi:hypothetical protein